MSCSNSEINDTEQTMRMDETSIKRQMFDVRQGQRRPPLALPLLTHVHQMDKKIRRRRDLKKIDYITLILWVQ